MAASGVFVVVVGAKQAQGQTPNLLINSHDGKMLFSADGSQAVIGPDKLRVTGRPSEAARRGPQHVSGCFVFKRRKEMKPAEAAGCAGSWTFAYLLEAIFFRLPQSLPTVWGLHLNPRVNLLTWEPSASVYHWGLFSTSNRFH